MGSLAQMSLHLSHQQTQHQQWHPATLELYYFYSICFLQSKVTSVLKSPPRCMTGVLTIQESLHLKCKIQAFQEDELQNLRENTPIVFFLLLREKQTLPRDRNV